MTGADDVGVSLGFLASFLPQVRAELAEETREQEDLGGSGIRVCEGGLIRVSGGIKKFWKAVVWIMQFEWIVLEYIRGFSIQMNELQVGSWRRQADMVASELQKELEFERQTDRLLQAQDSKPTLSGLGFCWISLNIKQRIERNILAGSDSQHPPRHPFALEFLR
ncbi:unnamed protein product [Rhodiola kirilowii]